MRQTLHFLEVHTGIAEGIRAETEGVGERRLDTRPDGEGGVWWGKCWLDDQQRSSLNPMDRNERGRRGDSHQKGGRLLKN